MPFEIAFVTHCPANPYTAVYMNVSSRAEHLRGLGHAVTIITPESLGFTFTSGIQPITFAVAVARHLRTHRFDAVIFHSHAGCAFFAARRWADPARRTATIIGFHGLEPLYHEAEEREMRRYGQGYSRRFRLLHRVMLHRLLRMSCRRADAIFCLNSTEREYLISERWTTPDRATIVANGVEPELLVERTPGGPTRRLVFVGQWIARKGIRYLAQAFAAVAAEQPGLELVCAGTGADADAVKSAFPDALRSRVIVYPTIGREVLARVLRDADVFVFPSLFEGFSGALLEGMAAGLAIVTTNAGAVPDLLQDGRNALFVPHADAPALADALRHLVLDPALRDGLGAAARRCAEAYVWPAVNATYSASVIGTIEQARRA